MPYIGYKQSEEHKQKVNLIRKSIGMTGKHHSEETKRKLSLTNRMYSHIQTDETKHKLSLANRGQYVSDETRQKISLKCRGYKHTEEDKRIIGLASQGRKLSEESKRKLSIARIGNPKLRGFHLTEEHKKKVSLALKGHITTDECKRKLSLSHGGDGIHFWRDNNDYPLEYYRIRPFILKRDNYTCQICNKEQPKIINVHHKDHNRKNNNPENLVTNCASCHSKFGKNNNAIRHP
jgi:hypothetical protein